MPRGILQRSPRDLPHAKGIPSGKVPGTPLEDAFGMGQIPNSNDGRLWTVDYRLKGTSQNGFLEVPISCILVD